MGRKASLFIRSISHLFVDALCAAVLYSSGAGFLELSVYDTLAFTTQCITGMVADRLRGRLNLIAAASCAMIAGSFFAPASSMVKAVAAGIGNSFFHTAAGTAVIKGSEGKAAPLGVFVAPGAIGLTLGTVFCDLAPFFAAGILICAALILFTGEPEDAVIEKGKDGKDGTDGVSPTVSVSEITGGHRVTVTDAEGSTSFDVIDGADGANGQNGSDGQPGQNGSDGADGYSPSASVTKSGGTATITITDKNGTTTATVSDGTDGDDYVLTSADKAEIAALAKDTVETVTGSTPTITAAANTRYICGEVTSLSFTPCGTGICDVRFTSGSTVTVLTVPNTVKWPSWFDPTSLETNTVYEINVEDGVYGVVAAWDA